MAVTIRAGVCVSPFYRHVSAACVRERVQVCVLVSVCAVQYLFPFIGDCGVCGKMSVAHFHTPIVFQWACRCGGYSPWLPGSPHHTWTLLGHGNGWLCGVVCVCVWGTEWKFMWFLFFIYFFFHAEFLQGTVLHYLGHRGVKKTARFGSRDDTSLNRQRHTGHPPPLRSPSAAEWQTKDFQAEDADTETHAHPSTNTLTNMPLNCSFYPPALWTYGMTDKAHSDLFLFSLERN